MVLNSKQHRKRARFSGVRHGRLPHSSVFRNISRALLTSLLVLTISGVGVAAYAVWDLANTVETVDLGGETPDGAMFSGQEFEGEFAMALIGSDTREGQTIQDDNEGELNDVNLLLYVDAKHDNATVISFPRDLMVSTPTCPGPNGEPDHFSAASERQLNSTLETGGLPCVVRTLEEMVGFDIPYAGVITFDGVINMSNAVGGVEVCLTEPILDPKTDLDLPAGDVTLVGMDALQFLRTRQGVGDGSDKSRISNQQVFMASMMRELTSAKTLSDPAKVFGLAKATVENVTLSTSLAEMAVLQSVAMMVKDLDLERINFVQFPTLEHAYDPNRLAPDWYSAEEFLQLMRQGVSFEVGGLGEGVQSADGPSEELTNEEEHLNEDVDGTVLAEDGEPLGGPENPNGSPTPSGPAKVGENISGQTAAQETCSQGRTAY